MIKRKKLPIGIETFSKLRNENCVYVDKTDIALRLIENGSYYFLSRPRRFGKSLFLNTLAEIFKGSKKLFEGLAIYDKWDWNRTFPVVKINFGGGRCDSPDSLKQKIKSLLKFNAESLGVDWNAIEKDSDDPGQQLFQLIYLLRKQYGEPVVVLIDEYDKPIIDNITDKKQAEINRNILAGFYSTIKACDEYLRFVMLTGVSKFSKVNLFSNLNNLKDITIDKNFATITGYTHQNLLEYFECYLTNVNLDVVRQWYNGYNYFGDPVYNPYDILLFLSENCKFKNYWWETGNPSFLIDLLRQAPARYLPELENTTVEEHILNSFDVDHIDLIALLWQTGYLTFAEEIVDELSFAISYKMKIPNLEIQRSLNALFLDYLTDLNGEKTTYALASAKALREGDPKALEASLKRLFSAIPYANYANNIIANYEGYYSSVLFTHIASIGYELVAEDYTNKGRIDLTVKAGKNVFIFEFKVDCEEPAIKQIKDRKYYEKYTDPDQNVFMVGINFSSQEKNIIDFKCEMNC